MRVPSRSRKMAGQPSLDEPVILEAGDEFVSRRRRRPKFSHDDGAGVVCNFGGFIWLGVAAQSQGKMSDRRVARAGNVENLLGFGGNVVRLFSSLKKHHSLFTQRDEQKLRSPFFEQNLAGF